MCYETNEAFQWQFSTRIILKRKADVISVSDKKYYTCYITHTSACNIAKINKATYTELAELNLVPKLLDLMTGLCIFILEQNH